MRFQTEERATRRLPVLLPVPRAAPPIPATAVAPRGAWFFLEEPVPVSKKALKYCALAVRATRVSSSPPAPATPKQELLRKEGELPREAQPSKPRPALTSPARSGSHRSARDFPAAARRFRGPALFSASRSTARSAERTASPPLESQASRPQALPQAFQLPPSPSHSMPLQQTALSPARLASARSAASTPPFRACWLPLPSAAPQAHQPPRVSLRKREQGSTNQRSPGLRAPPPAQKGKRACPTGAPKQNSALA